MYLNIDKNSVYYYDVPRTGGDVSGKADFLLQLAKCAAYRRGYVPQTASELQLLHNFSPISNVPRTGGDVSGKADFLLQLAKCAAYRRGYVPQTASELQLLHNFSPISS